MDIQTFHEKSLFITESAHVFSRACAKPGPIHIALSGGSTPVPIYRAIGGRADIPFDRLELYQVDERYVRSDHPDSNHRMITQSLRVSAQHKLKKFHSFDTSLPIDEALNEYEHTVARVPERSFDLMVLGIGQDGHIASLFPFSDALSMEKHLVAHTQTETFAVHDRLTLTLPIILKSKKILVLLNGMEKHQVLEKMKKEETTIENFPAKALFQHPNVLVHFCPTD
jgi:6-phosphogluconolactonase